MKPLWKPTQEQISQANLTHFMRHVSMKYHVAFETYDDFYQWSIDHPYQFWLEVWIFCNVTGRLDDKTVFVPDAVFYKSRFFRDSRMNFAENLLKNKGVAEAIIFWNENGIQRRLTYDQLFQEVAQVASALKNLGIQSGDRVVGFLPNMPETVISMLATTSLGAIWSSCSPDFGVQGVLDRFLQIEPKVLFVSDGYYFKGKSIDIGHKLQEIVQQLPSLEQVVIIPYTGQHLPTIAKSINYQQFIHAQSAELTFTSVLFNHPLFIMFSSGTTGIPKCIVHGHGGTLLQHLKEHQFHCDIKPGDRVFYYTTCGWMMWNWLVSCLASKATIVLYDGHPFYPNWQILFEMAEQEHLTFFGVSAKYIDVLNKEGAKPKLYHDLSHLKTIASTGSPLSPENFDYIYQEVAPQVNLASISGGTDIISCFALGNPILPVWRGELQSRGLGMKVEVLDDTGQSIKEQKGELVCTAPFPSMPICFWKDPQNQKLRDAYFAQFPNVWCHGDYVELTKHNGLKIYGRSDAVLNPGGVRIGTAEIYRQVAQIPDVLESIVVGQTWKGDVRVILFVKLRENVALTEALVAQIRTQIRNNASPRHVPDLILSVPDIPHTVNEKVTELAVSHIIHGREVKNKEALANPEALEYFKNRVELSK